MFSITLVCDGDFPSEEQGNAGTKTREKKSHVCSSPRVRLRFFDSLCVFYVNQMWDPSRPECLGLYLKMG